jgi:preprotein translocase subunit SecA
MAHHRALRLKNLDRKQRDAVLRLLREQDLIADDPGMRTLRNQRLRDLEEGVYQDLLQDLGRQIVAAWGTESFGELGQDQQALLSAYLGRRIMGRIERRVLLHTISRLWIDYLTDIEDLRRGIGLEAYGQRDPLVEYKRRAFELFEELRDNIRRTVVRSLFRQPPEALDATQY